MQFPRRITSLDKGYRHGDLSVFPRAIDTRVSLYEAVNNAETKLLHNLTSASKYIIVEDASRFPDNGILRISGHNGVGQSTETIFYGRKIGNQFHLLQRGMGHSSATNWQAGALVSSPVMAEHHNALKDAIINIQRKIGTLTPGPDTLHAQLRQLEQRWLTPKAVFKAFPKMALPGTAIRFQNFSIGHGLRFLWDFGDGVTSTEKSPTHVFNNEGAYTVKLNVVSSNGAAGFTEKANYIHINNDQRKPFFYGAPLSGQSKETAADKEKSQPTTFTFVDQTDGSIVERHWYFGDGQDVTISNPNLHTISHTYDKAGEYHPTLLVRYADDRVSRAILTEGVTVF